MNSTTRHPRIDSANALGRVDRHAFHACQVDDEAVGGPPSHWTVTPASYSHFQSISARKFDGAPDVIGLDTPRNRHRSLFSRVGVPIIDAARRLITGVRGDDKTTLQLCAELVESVRIDLPSVGGFELTGGCGPPVFRS